MRRLTKYAAIAAAFVAAMMGVTSSQAASPAATAGLPPVRHVFVIVLENASYSQSYGPASKYPYLRGILRPQGVLLSQYYATSHYSLGNYLSILSGLAPNADTQGDCPYYREMAGAERAPLGQVRATKGCIFPSWVPTLADQLSAKNLSWKGYMEDMGNNAGREEASCGKPSLGPYSSDLTQHAAPGDAYTARHNPFLYFDSIMGTPACTANVVPLTRLPSDLATTASTPNFSFISPSLCNDGHEQSCTGQPAGPAAEDAWLRTWVGRITSSAAFKADGALFIVNDEADGDSSSCCNEQPGPNLARPGTPPLAPQAPGFTDRFGDGKGGGRTGALAISPFIRGGSQSSIPYNHYSLLRSIEDLFGLPYLGYAGQSGLLAFGRDIWNRYRPAPTG